MTTNRQILLTGACALCLCATAARAADPAPPVDPLAGVMGSADAEKIASSNAPAGAPAATKSTTILSTTANSDENYLDDMLVWTTDIAALTYPNADTALCIPANTRLLGRSAKVDTSIKNADGSAKSLVRVELDPGRLLGSPQQAMSCSRDPVTGARLKFGPDGKPMKDSSAKPYGYGPDANGKYNTVVYVDANAPGTLPPEQLGYITSDVADSADSRAGFDFGALAVPFKVQMTGKQAFSSSSSVGGYLGYRMPFFDTGLEFSPILFAGASNISVPAAAGSSSSTETVAGLSYGLGFVTKVKDSIQVGLVVGFDHVDSSSYAYNDKPWLSFEIGYSFAQ